MSEYKEFWSGLQDKNRDVEVLQDAIEKEFVEHVPIAAALQDEQTLEKTSSSRRDFLKYLGFSLGAATVAASCEIPVKRAIPYVIKPDDIVPGVANYYASTFNDNGSALPIVVKTREGRPIKIEGNTLSTITGGGTSARAQASVLSLYDTFRYQQPLLRSEDKLQKSSWADLDKSVKEKLATAKGIKIISHTNNGPTAKAAVEAFKTAYPSTEWVMYDACSYAAQLEANAKTFGTRALPNYSFDKASTIVSFDADFLGTWISPVRFASDYIKNRKIADPDHPKMSRHIQVESRMSYTGSNADERVLVKPSAMASAVATLYNTIASASGLSSASGANLDASAAAKMEKVAKELMAAKGKSLVVSGINNLGIQLMINGINEMLGNYGSTLSMARPVMAKMGDERKMQKAMADLESGQADTVIIWGSNPAFELPNGEKFTEILAKTKTVIALSFSPDETCSKAGLIAPTHHYLESWGDSEIMAGAFSIAQPTIAPLFDTRQAELSFLTWAGAASKSEDPYYDFMRDSWRTRLSGDFEKAWTELLFKGVYEGAASSESPEFDSSALSGIAVTPPSSSELEINLYETINVGAGEYASNPWLQELPDPVMRTVWGNYLAIPVNYNKGTNAFDSFQDLKSEGKGSSDIAETSINGVTRPLTIVPQFGQLQNTLAIGLGYGRTIAGRCARVGQDVNACLTYDDNGFIQYWSDNVQVKGRVGEDSEFACVQYHHTYGVTAVNDEGETFNADEEVLGYQGSLLDRSIMRYGYLDDVKTLKSEIKTQRDNAEHLNIQTLYPSYEDKYKEGHHWSMFVDMNACIGCGACAIACMAENNVPIVGKKEVHRHHEMTWIRIDRYYFGDAENPNVVYQPMMCQHCDNAPCENVCPVAATNHSSEGLNQMTYNRCIGTRYCANNCPYKVRRFNWLDYTSADLFGGNENYIDDEQSIPMSADNLTRMVLNPDVTVRSRGVIEKCSFCVQRIQESKLSAKKDNRALVDGDVKTACQTACPTGAIVFGDDNDPNSEVSMKMKSSISYKVLEEVNTDSSVHYSAKVVNRKDRVSKETIG